MGGAKKKNINHCPPATSKAMESGANREVLHTFDYYGEQKLQRVSSGRTGIPI
ncbi:hypothetical protein D3C77_730710 [compost metagenome]